MKPVLAALLLICAGLPARAEVGDWVLTHVDGAAVGYSATLSLSQAGRVTGQAPCNRYFADVVRGGGRDGLCARAKVAAAICGLFVNLWRARFSLAGGSPCPN